MHGYDVHHILVNIKKKLKSADNLKRFSLLTRLEDKKKFEIELDRLYADLPREDIPVLDKFVKNSEHYCFSQMSH